MRLGVHVGEELSAVCEPFDHELDGIGGLDDEEVDHEFGEDGVDVLFDVLDFGEGWVHCIKKIL